ncbi:unannotated protein [freshwater metagenome]|uniref:Unannotated protein n=1 Tax=freshwater metagenome TaxID=449393 RepID=A0A6J7QT31_9ZZZZ
MPGFTSPITLAATRPCLSITTVLGIASGGTTGMRASSFAPSSTMLG